MFWGLMLQVPSADVEADLYETAAYVATQTMKVLDTLFTEARSVHSTQREADNCDGGVGVEVLPSFLPFAAALSVIRVSHLTRSANKSC